MGGKLCWTMLYCVKVCYTMLYHATPCCTMLHYATLCLWVPLWLIRTTHSLWITRDGDSSSTNMKFPVQTWNFQTKLEVSVCLGMSRQFQFKDYLKWFTTQQITSNYHTKNLFPLTLWVNHNPCYYPQPQAMPVVIERQECPHTLRKVYRNESEQRFVSHTTFTFSGVGAVFR